MKAPGPSSEPALKVAPAVCVVIPCYNVRPYLEECLRSVLAQDFTDWEALIVNDCSTDGDPGEIVRALGDPRLRLLHHARNRGLAAARNTGFLAARSPYVLPLDADDVLEPTFLSRLMELLKGDPALDCAFTNFQLFGAMDSVREMGVRPAEELTDGQWLPGPGVLMKRSLWERTGGYCEADVLRLGNEDWDFWLSAAEKGFHAAHLPEPLYRYRQHQANMSHTLRVHDHVTRAYMLRRHDKIFGQTGNGRHFLSVGYRRSAEAARHARRPFRSLYLGARAALLEGGWPLWSRLARNNFRQWFSPDLSTPHAKKG